MFLFCIFIISTMTIIKAQRTVHEELTESSDWFPKIDVRRKSNSSKSHEENFKNGERIFVPSNNLNFSENYRKFVDSITEKSQNKTGHEAVNAPRSLSNRAKIDSGAKSLNTEDILSKIKHDSFEVVSTNIPLLETFRDQFMEKKAKDDMHENSWNQNKPSVNIDKDGTQSNEKLQKTENIATTVKPQTSKLNQISHANELLVKSSVNNGIAKHDLEQTKTQVNGNLTRDKLGSNGPMQTTKTTVIIAKKEMGNVATGSVVELKTKSEEERKKQQPSFESKLAESTTHAKRGLAPSKNDTESANYLARFRKQILNWQNKGPVSTINGVTVSPPAAPSHFGYSTLPLRQPETLPHYRTDYYTPTAAPVKRLQFYPAQGFTPIIPAQSFILDQPPNFSQFERQDQEVDQIYPPDIPSYASLPLKNNSYYNTPFVNYYYPSVNYQPKPQPEIELTTQGYPPLAPPSQTYQVPSYHYGPPAPSQNYGPPQLIPGELLPLQEQKPYFPESNIKISLSDEQCVMSREIPAEAAIEVSLSFGRKRSQPRNCALMFGSGFNIAISSMIQSDQNATTVDLVRQLNLKMFSVQPTGHVLQIKFPWYQDDKSPGLTLGDSGTIIITFQPSTSLTLKFLIFSYRDSIPRMPVIVSYVLTANATEPLMETNLTNEKNETDETEATGSDEKFIPVSLEQDPVILKVF